jgi:hypothetical protein
MPLYVRYGTLADILRCGNDVRFTLESDRNSRHRESRRRAEHFLLCPIRSNLHLLRNGEGIVDIYTEIADGALYPGVTEQQLDGPQIPGAAVAASATTAAPVGTYATLERARTDHKILCRI